MNGIKLYVFIFFICFYKTSIAEGKTVYKCVSSSGTVTYQPKPCKNSVKTDLIEIKKFNPPEKVKEKSAEKKRSTGIGGRNNYSPTERKKERTLANCKNLKKNYQRYLRQAKEMDKRRIKAVKNQKKNRSNVNERALRKLKKKQKGI